MNAQEIYELNFNAGLKPDPIMTVSEWADNYRYLPKVSAKEAGKYRTERTPFLREIMDALSPSSPVTEICVIKGTQLGCTEAANNFLGFIIDISPGPVLFVLPTVELAKDHSKAKLAPMISETPRLRGRVKEPRARDSGNTILVKQFMGGMLFLTGSNSGAGFRSRSIRYLILDDLDGYEIDVSGEGSPVELAKKRTDTYGRLKKILEISTPTIKGVSNIERAYEESDQREYHVPCPHCSKKQVLEWGGTGFDYGIKFNRNEQGHVTDVWYKCKHCHTRIDESNKTDMLAKGEWIPKYPERLKRGYHISGLLSPLGFVSWKQIVIEFLEVKNNPERLKVWVNTRLGLPFEEIGEQPEWVNLSSRCEPYPIMTVPSGGLFLTAGVDTQDDRLAVVIRAWGRQEESWLIFWGELLGDPAQSEVWNQLDNLLNYPFKHQSGTALNIICMAIDSQGHRTQPVYNYCRTRLSRGVIAIQGASQSGKPVISRPSYQDVNFKGKVIKKGVQLWTVGTEIIKSTIYSRLSISDKGAGYYHFPIGLEDEYFLELTGEKLVTRYKDGIPVKKWVQTRSRVEALDCEVYAYAAAYLKGIARTSPAVWDELENTVNAVQDVNGIDKEAEQHDSQIVNTPTQRPKKTYRVAKSRFLS
ncbi:MAG: phage terminase large subunit family protein [Desulfobacterales bacterium]|nr:phage terminase large subunit family protein [Desulfobacterales bacterium]